MMALFSNQRAAGLVGLTLFIFLLLGYTTYNSRAADNVPFNYASSSQQDAAGAPTLSQPGPADGWDFDAKRDAKNYGLSPEQCDAAFPKLWAELDRAVAHRKKIGKITPDEVKIGWKVDGIVRAMIYDRQVYRQLPHTPNSAVLTSCFSSSSSTLVAPAVETTASALSLSYSPSSAPSPPIPAASPTSNSLSSSTTALTLPSTTTRRQQPRGL